MSAFDDVMRKYGLPGLEPDPRPAGTGTIEERLAALRELLGVGDKDDNRSGGEGDGKPEETDGNRD